jgi:hypothetical protein
MKAICNIWIITSFSCIHFIDKIIAILEIVDIEVEIKLFTIAAHL